MNTRSELRYPVVPEKECPNCRTSSLSAFYEVRKVPVHSVLLMKTREEAVHAPTGDITLGFCPACGFIGNTSFDGSLLAYSADYEETQGFSSTFQTFHRRLAVDLIDRYDLREKHIIEIGCGKGEFITLLCELGPNFGVGFDPSYVSDRNCSEARERITFIKDFYSEKYADCQGDFVCCKMTLEHIPDVSGFLSTVRRAIGEREDTTVFFQVPDVARVLQEKAFWDIYHEHCSYFSRISLAHAFRSQGFDVLNLWTDYDDQYLMIEARPGKDVSATVTPDANEPESFQRSVASFQKHVPGALKAWKQALRSMHLDRQRVVLWGGGSKAASFLTTLGIGGEVDYVVDINPYRQGTFVAGTGHRIVGPDFLPGSRPDAVVIMNPIYRVEIQRTLQAMGLSPVLLDITSHCYDA